MTAVKKVKELFNKMLDANSVLNITDVSSSAYWVTPHLRYAKKYIQIDEQTAKWELRLQQMWQGSDGSQKWEWVEIVE